MSQPTSAVVIKTVPAGTDPTQTAQTSGGNQDWISAVGNLTGSLLGGALANKYKEDEVEAQAQALAAAETADEGLGATPWIVGGIALVGIGAVAWAFWPRD